MYNTFHPNFAGRRVLAFHCDVALLLAMMQDDALVGPKPVGGVPKGARLVGHESWPSFVRLYVEHESFPVHGEGMSDVRAGVEPVKARSGFARWPTALMRGDPVGETA